jgi:hypothetical protein
MIGAERFQVSTPQFFSLSVFIFLPPFISVCGDGFLGRAAAGWDGSVQVVVPYEDLAWLGRYDANGRTTAVDDFEGFAMTDLGFDL